MGEPWHAGDSSHGDAGIDHEQCPTRRTLESADMSKQEMRDPKQWAILLTHLQEIICLLELGSIGDNGGSDSPIGSLD